MRPALIAVTASPALSSCASLAPCGRRRGSRAGICRAARGPWCPRGAARARWL